MSLFRSPLVLLIPLLLIVWGIAVWGADADAIWIDEWWSAHYSGTAPNNELDGPLAVIDRVASQGSAHENNPVGYYVTLHLWSRLVGKSDLALRLFSGLCIVLSVALMYQLGRSTGGLRVGVISAFLLGLSAFFLNYSHDMRMYGQVALCGVLMLLSYWRFMHAKHTPWAWGIALMLSAAGLLYTHYGNALLIGLLGLIHLFLRPKTRRWWYAIDLFVGTILLFSPHLFNITLNIFNRFVVKTTTEDNMPLGIWTVPEMLHQVIFGFVNEQPILLLAIVIAFLITLRMRLRPNEQKGLIFSGMLCLGGIVTLIVLLKAFQTLFHVRYLLVIWIPMALFSALVLTISVQRLRQSLQTWVLSAFVAAWGVTGGLLALDIHFHGIAYSHPFFHDTLIEPTRWDLIEPVLRDETRPSDALVVSVGEYKPWIHIGSAEYYTYGQPARLLLLEAKDVDESKFDDFIHGAGRVWMARTLEQPPAGEFLTMQEHLKQAGYQACGPVRQISNMALEVYSVMPQCCEAPQMAGTPFGDVATLRSTLDVSREGSIAVWQAWEVTSQQREKYSIGLYAFDAEGNVVGQRDMPLPPVGYNCILSEFQTTEPDAALRLAVYDWETQVRQPLSESSTDQLWTIQQ